MTPDARSDLWSLADGIQMDLRAAHGKLVELRAQLAALNLPDATRVKCPSCFLTFSRPSQLAEHRYLQHDGPEPAHWLAAEALAASEIDTADPDDPGRLEHRGKAAGVNGLTAPGSGDEA